MAPSTKENEILIAPPEKNSSASIPAAPRFDETTTASRPQPVALEIPVSVNGARTVEGSDKREPFSETTKTVLVFGNGAVIRLGSPVAAGQLLFLTNEKTKKEVVCQVVKSKNYKSVSGYVELEFTESVVGFWGMRFPSDRIAAPAPVSASAPSVLPAAKSTPVVSAAIASPRISEVRLVQTQAPQVQAPQVHAEVKPVAPQPRPAEVSVALPPAPKPQSPSVQSIPAPVTPVAKKPEAPAGSSLASSLASLLGAPELPPAAVSSKPPAPPLQRENKPQPASAVADNSTEDLKLQAARLQEQLSSLLFSANAKPAAPAPVMPELDQKAVSGVSAQVLEMPKSEPSPIRLAPPARPLPPPIKSSLDTEEVKIPSWLEPLARNAAAPSSPQELVEREKAKHATEAAGAHEVRADENLSLTALESVPESALPTIGNLLPLDEEVITQQRSGGSGRGVLYGAIAAGVLLAAGGVWYFLQPSNAARGTSAPAVSAPSSPSNATTSTPSVTQPATQPVQPVSQPPAQSSTAAPSAVSSSNSTPASSVPSSNASGVKSAANGQPAPVIRDNTRGAAIPAAATERISRPTAEPEPKKPALGQVHLASPTVNRIAAAQDEGAEAPSISSGNANGLAGGIGSGLAGNAKQPAAPEAPLPIGGDVKTAKLISSVPPIYPGIAKSQRVSGDVRVDALIDVNGRVTTMKVISGPTLLHQAAMDALRQWKYQPAMLDGKAVPMHLNVTLQFRLQ